MRLLIPGSSVRAPNWAKSFHNLQKKTIFFKSKWRTASGQIKNLFNFSIFYITEKTIQPKTSKKGWSLANTVFSEHHTARLAESLEHGILPPRVVGSSPTLSENFLCSKNNILQIQLTESLKANLKKPLQFFYNLYNKKKQFNRRVRKKDDHYQTQSLGYHHTARLTQSLEHGILPPRVVGSTLTLVDNFL